MPVEILERKCKYCSRKIVYATNPDTGRLVPIDIQTPVYLVSKENATARQMHNEGDRLVGVNHFVTCSGREQAKAAVAESRKQAKLALEKNRTQNTNGGG